jgi:hypothetical protein
MEMALFGAWLSDQHLSRAIEAIARYATDLFGGILRVYMRPVGRSAS